MRYWLTLIFLLFFQNTIFSQSVDQVKADHENYYWGEGSGSTIKKADDEALSMLINQISTQVESSFELLKQESGNEYNEKAKSVIKTYSAATLKNTERIIMAEEPAAKVFRYINRAEVYKIFEERKEKIVEFAKYGDQALKDFQIADALKYYYWALTLLRSHPKGSTIKSSSGESMALWLPIQINKVLTGISATLGELIKENGYSIQMLKITFKGTPVANYDYAYWDENNWSNIISAKDGVGCIEFPYSNPEIKEVKIKTEYIFENEASIDKELEDVMQKLDPVPFHESSIIARLANVKVSQDTMKAVVAPTVSAISSTAEKKEDLIFNAVTNTEPYLKIVNELKDAIRKANYESARPLFTPSGFDVFTKLVQYGKARLLTAKELLFLRQKDEVFCRAIPMSFSFKNNKQFVEDLVLNFDSAHKISNLSFALGAKSLSDINAKTTWPEKARMQMISFIENYKTAYALKRLDYIESIFSDDALILVGSVLKVQSGEMNQYQNNQIVKYNRLTKQEYVKKLKFAFGSKEYINLKFEDNEVRKSGKGEEVYGIQIKQNFYSSNYSDAGYLFLMIDFANPELPLIHIRTWQPEKSADGSIYGLNDFN